MKLAPRIRFLRWQAAARSAAGSRPRLCTVVHGSYPPDVRIARQTRAAIDAGWSVEIIATRQPGQVATETIERATVRRLPLRHLRGRGIMASIWEYSAFTALATLTVAWRHMRKPYAAVQINNPPDFLLAAGLLPRACGAMLIFDVHDRSPDMFDLRFAGRGWQARAINALLSTVERLCLRIADHVVTVHEPYRDILVASGAPPDKTTVVMNSVDERMIEGICATGGSPDAPLRIVYHGTVTPHYGVQLLVKAVAMVADDLPDFKLEIYGDGDAIDEVRLLADQYGIKDRTLITGCYLPHREALERISGASIGVNPNLPTRHDRRAIATKLFEYVLLGIPVVSADLPAVRQHFGDEHITYFAAGDARSLAESITRVAANRAQAQKRAAAARDRYERYRWPVQAARYVEVLERAHDRTRCQ